MNKSDALIESYSLRQSYANRTDVLDKVKKLVMLPDDVNASVELVADYYEVPKSTIEAVIHENRNEIESDGLKVVRGEELTWLKQVGVIGKNSAAFTIIPRRAILRIGMLLRDSLVARSLRDRILDDESERPKFDVSALPKELQLVKTMWDSLALQHIEQQALKNEVGVLKDGLETLTDNLTAVPDAEKVKDLLNEYQRWTRLDFDQAYNKVYDIMLDRHGIDVKRMVKNERNRLDAAYFEKTGRHYSESTLKGKTSGIDVMVRHGVLDKFHTILVGLLAKVKGERKL